MTRIARPILAGLVLISAVALVGCGQASPSASSAATVGAPPTAAVLRTREPAPSGIEQACMAAFIEGTLVRDERSALAVRDLKGLVRQVIWPNGYSALEDGGRLAVLDGSGNVVVHEGDRISIGGGPIDAEGTWLGCGGITVIGP